MIQIELFCFDCKKVMKHWFINQGFEPFYKCKEWNLCVPENTSKNLKHNQCDWTQNNHLTLANQQSYRCSNKIDLDKVDAPSSIVHILKCGIWFEGVDRHNNWKCKQCYQLYCAQWVQDNIQHGKSQCINWCESFTINSLYADASIKRIIESLKYKIETESSGVCSEHGIDATAYWEPCQEQLCVKCLINNKHLSTNNHKIISYKKNKSKKIEKRYWKNWRKSGW